MSDWMDLTQKQRLWTIINDNLNIADSPNEITCPWCNAQQTYIENEDISYDDESITELECNDCGKKFEAETVVTYDWRTKLPEDYLVEQAKKITE